MTESTKSKMPFCLDCEECFENENEAKKHCNIMNHSGYGT